MRSTGLAFILLLTLPATGRASTMLALDLAELSLTSDEIVVAEVVGQRAEPTRGGIVTRVVVRVELGIAGHAGPGDELEIILPGGELDGVGMLVHGTPRLALGEQYLLFLRRHAPEYQVAGLAQGVFPLERSVESGELLVTAPQNLPGLVRIVSGRFQPADPAISRPTLLEEIVARVQEARHGR